MNYLKRNSLVLSLAVMVLAAFVSCEEDSNGGTDFQGSDDVKITGVKVTAFTASVTGVREKKYTCVSGAYFFISCKNSKRQRNGKKKCIFATNLQQICIFYVYYIKSLYDYTGI